MSDDEKYWYSPNSPQAPPRQAQPGELLFEFHVERTHTFWRCELRTHSNETVEAQFLDPVDIRMARTFRQDMDPKRTARDGESCGLFEERTDLEQRR